MARGQSGSQAVEFLAFLPMLLLTLLLVWQGTLAAYAALVAQGAAREGARAAVAAPADGVAAAGVQAIDRARLGLALGRPPEVRLEGAAVRVQVWLAVPVVWTGTHPALVVRGEAVMAWEGP